MPLAVICEGSAQREMMLLRTDLEGIVETGIAAQISKVVNTLNRYKRR